MSMDKEIKIGVIGLGYVGLPLAVELSKKFDVTGYDINQKRISELAEGYDRTLELTHEDMQAATNITFTADNNDLQLCNFYIVTVPTPVDKHNRPDLTPLVSASELVAQNLNVGDIVVYESTVYPGATEEECVPILERISGLQFNVDFFCGYSPERINPGDRVHTVANIKKVTSGSTTESAEIIDSVYREVITAGTHKAASIKVAEAAKVIENAQRDINIAFVNELAIIFDKLGIKTQDVLEAAGTKWNFLQFKPGLVGGHCIGVDPYYLTHKAQEIGHHPEIILAGRRLNDYMSVYVANKLIKEMIKKGQTVNSAKVLVLGVTFKENCPDMRNSKVFDVINELEAFGCQVDVWEPWVESAEINPRLKGSALSEMPDLNEYQALLVAVGHSQFAELDIQRSSTLVVYDLKSMFTDVDATL